MTEDYIDLDVRPILRDGSEPFGKIMEAIAELAPEPMVRILAALKTMQEGEVLSALLCRKPTFLIPEIEKRGHTWRGDFEPDGKTYKILVCVGRTGNEAA